MEASRGRVPNGISLHSFILPLSSMHLKRRKRERRKWSVKSIVNRCFPARNGPERQTCIKITPQKCQSALKKFGLLEGFQCCVSAILQPIHNEYLEYQCCVSAICLRENALKSRICQNVLKWIENTREGFVRVETTKENGKVISINVALQSSAVSMLVQCRQGLSPP